MENTAYSKYVPEWERPVITALCKKLLDKGYKLAIHNGEEYESKLTDKWHSLRPHFGSTGEDWVRVFRKLDNGEREYLGYWYLIYNNGSEGDPMIVISDYSWTNDDYEAQAEEIWSELSSKYDS